MKDDAGYNFLNVTKYPTDQQPDAALGIAAPEFVSSPKEFFVPNKKEFPPVVGQKPMLVTPCRTERTLFMRYGVFPELSLIAGLRPQRAKDHPPSTASRSDAEYRIGTVVIYTHIKTYHYYILNGMFLQEVSQKIILIKQPILKCRNRFRDVIRTGVKKLGFTAISPQHTDRKNAVFCRSTHIMAAISDHHTAVR